MTIDEWLAAEVARLHRFAEWWAMCAPVEKWPDQMAGPEWDEQYTLWEEPNATPDV